MKNKSKATLQCVMSSILLSCSIVFADERVKQDTIVRSNSSFAIDLYRELRMLDGNLFFSPYSISTALAMTYAGASGNTKKEMATILKFTHFNQEDLHSAFKGLAARLNEIQKTGNVKLSNANSLWPQRQGQDYKFRAEYLHLIEKYYGVSITPVDYQRAAEATRRTINTWVADKTQDKIKDLIKPGIISTLTRLVLVNAIYFKGNWANQFETSNTKDAPFYVSSQSSVQTPMMVQEHKFRYAETETLKILEVPYVGDELAMIILLPHEAAGLKQLENSLTIKNLQDWKDELREKSVLVYLPKFKMASTFRLDNALMSMGMLDAFSSEKADFAGMDGRSDWLYIMAVLHKAFVEVNEEGTEASAATAVVMGGRGIRSTPIFPANHPFIFLIHEKRTGSILFMGRVVDPTKAGE